MVSTVGGTPADPRADSEGNIALIEAAAKKGEEQGRMPKPTRRCSTHDPTNGGRGRERRGKGI